MDNPEILETLDIQDRTKTSKTQNKRKHNIENYNDVQRGSHQNPGLNPGAREG